MQLKNINFKWAGLTSLYLVLILWNISATGKYSFSAGAIIFSILLFSMLLGDIIQKFALNDSDCFNNQPTRLLTGLLLANILLLIASVISPFGMTINWIVLLFVTLIIWIYARGTSTFKNLIESNKTETIFFITVPLVVTAWCQDILMPIELNTDVIIIRAWQDIFYHIAQISEFAKSHGIGTISDVQMATATVHPYHMASYMLPALMVDAAGTNALAAYGSLLVPLGIFATGLAAYSLANVVFGQWPALAASLALVLIPDAAQQGWGNGFLGYQWLQQIGPASLYGVASAACVFMFILKFCQTPQYRLILIAYFFSLVTLFYKAQIFVAISYIALILPALFIKGRLAKYKILFVVILTFFYFTIAIVAQTIPSIPVMRLDGSGLDSYISSILGIQSDGFIKQLFLLLFKNSMDFWLIKSIVFSVMLIFCTAGVLPILYLYLLKHLKNNFTTEVWLFPIMVTAIFLIMSCGLAMDTRHIGSPEELLHRPFVWFYFVLVVWCAGAAYHYKFGDAIPTKRPTRWLLTILVLLLFTIPIKFGEKVQFFELTGLSYQKISKCSYEVAVYIKQNSQIHDVVQDSMNDKQFIMTALSERKPFAIDSGGLRTPAGIESRLDLLKELKKLKAAQDVEIFMKMQGIRWYVVSPMSFLMWEATVNKHLVFECGGYKTYYFEIL